MKIHVLNTLEGLKPCTDTDYEAKKKLKIGQVYRVEIRRPRNYEFLKKYFALLNRVWENMPEKKHQDMKRFDNFRNEITKATGYKTEYVDIHGVVQEKALSISFGSMSAEDFEDLYSKTIDVILRDYIPGLERSALEEEVLAFT